MDRADAIALFARADVVRIASSTAEGQPVFRTVHGVVIDDRWIAFHGAPAGEKTEAIGREAVVVADETIAPLPSYFFDPERACPATTLYRSVQAHGPIEEVTDAGEKARVLAALMEKLQPEGGYRPIDPEHALYRRAVAGILVLRVSLERLDGKAKLAQNKRPAERARLLELLWKRGLPCDPRAIDLIRAAAPDTPTPPFLAFHDDVEIVLAPTPRDAEGAADLLVDVYWNTGRFSRDAIVRAHARSPSWIVARDRTGAVIGSVRAVSDGAKHAWIYDVIVAEGWRRRGLGARLVELLLDHPEVRNTALVWLKTRDAQRLYAKFGFRDREEIPPRPFKATEMILIRNTEGGPIVSSA